MVGERGSCNVISLPLEGKSKYRSTREEGLIVRDGVFLWVRIEAETRACVRRDREATPLRADVSVRLYLSRREWECLVIDTARRYPTLLCLTALGRRFGTRIFREFAQGSGVDTVAVYTVRFAYDWDLPRATSMRTETVPRFLTGLIFGTRVVHQRLLEVVQRAVRLGASNVELAWLLTYCLDMPVPARRELPRIVFRIREELREAEISGEVDRAPILNGRVDDA